MKGDNPSDTFSGGSTSAAPGKSMMWPEESDLHAEIDKLLAGIGYKVRSSDIADVAQKLEQLEEVMDKTQEEGVRGRGKRDEGGVRETEVREKEACVCLESNSKSKAMEVLEDKLKIIEKHTVLTEAESEAQFSNQEASSLTSEWTAPEVNLANGRCSELPENPNCPFLVKLFLQHNTYLTEIPALFFENMPVLQVLDMSNTSIKTLPSSIFKLFRLQELFLRGCEMLMELPPEIGRLANLKVLDLEGTELVSLPKEVGLLLQLACLKFSLYKFADHHKEIINGIERSIISRETLSKLSSLKELSINVDPKCDWWDVEVEAIVSDLGELVKLRTLKLYFPTVKLLDKFLQLPCAKKFEWADVMPYIYRTLYNFSFIVGRHNDRIMSSIPRDLQDQFVKLDKCLKYVNGEGDMDAIIANALKHFDALFLYRHWTIQRLSDFNGKKMDNLKFCLIAECNEMETILGGRLSLRSLHYLGIHYMKNLCSIWRGPIVVGSFSSLKILAIHTCPELRTIFNLTLLDNLVFLQELIVEDCPKVWSLVTQDSSLLQHKEFLPRLTKISLLHLPKLHDISRGIWIAPRLEKMVVYDCPNLNHRYPLEICSRSIKEIKGESEWWESVQKQYDYLDRVFVPLEDDDLNDELAEAVQVSLNMSQEKVGEKLAAQLNEKNFRGKEKM
ncbi:hypothetical protein LguiB_006631 [Lonicera macranthoides]